MEVNLATIDGQVVNERLQVVLCTGDASSRVELRQQSWGDGIGWFTQSSISLQSDQVGQLKSVLGATKTPRRDVTAIQSELLVSVPFVLRAHPPALCVV